MKRNNTLQLLGLGLVLTIGVVGCKHKPSGVTHLPNGSTGVTGDGNGLDNGLKTSTDGVDGANSTKSSDITGGVSQERTHNGWNKDAEMFKADTVHFDYDSTVIKSGDRSKVAHVADYLKGNPAAAVEVDGHCDERGTDEYNRALGERRALAIREQLVSAGVEASRVETVSFGRDKPVDTGRSDSAHAKNRRGEFILLTAPGAK
jgi:peptidoglycan-associated lipoprotein